MSRLVQPSAGGYIFTALLVLLIAALLGVAGPALDDHSAATDDATAQQRAQARFAKAAQAMCGENAGWADLGNGSVQCRTKRGHKTIVAQVAP